MKIVEHFIDRAIRRDTPGLIDISTEQLEATLAGERRRKVGEYAGFCALYIAANAPLFYAGLVRGQFPLGEASVGIGANIMAGIYGMVIGVTTNTAIGDLHNELDSRRGSTALELDSSQQTDLRSSVVSIPTQLS